jgi:hypothetical protein
LASAAFVCTLTLGCGSSTGTEPAGSGRPAGAAHVRGPDGAERSILEFGRRASREEGKAVVAAMRRFVTALGAGRWEAVCHGMARAARAEIGGFAPAGHRGCKAAAARIVTRLARARAVRAADAAIADIRVHGDEGIVIFRAAGEWRFLAMRREGRSWKATALAPGVPLRP